MRFTIPRLLLNIGERLTMKVDHYAAFNPSSLSVKQIIDFGRKGDQVASYLFLRKELMVRLANILKEYNLLPQRLLRMPSARLVEDWYHKSFENLLTFEEANEEKNTLATFLDTLRQILTRHAQTVETMAEALIEFKKAYGVDISTERQLQYFLDRFYINRISIRMLMNQHILLFGTPIPESPRHVGAIDPQCHVEAVINEAYDNASFLCDRYYLSSPGLKIETRNVDDKEELPITVAYVPSHLYHIMFELFKNAMRAVMEFHTSSDKIPELTVLVVKGKEDLSIKLCDRGGGVPRSQMELLFNYMYSTAPPPQPTYSGEVPLAGLGYGLPLSRLYARYFLGDLMLVSMEGYGTDACVYLKAVSKEANELLPVYSNQARLAYKHPQHGSDWSHYLPSGSRFYSTWNRVFQVR